MRKTLRVQLKNGQHVTVGSAAFKDGRRMRNRPAWASDEWPDWLLGCISRYPNSTVRSLL